MISTKLLGIVASLIYFAGPSIADHSCPPDGPILPRPTALASQAAFKSAGTNLSHILESVIKGKIESGFPIENTSFSISVTSLDDKHGKPAWEYHHRGANNVKGTKKVDGDTQYLIGSISKVFTDLLLLKTGLNLDDPITKYLPELISNDSPISWKDISLRALGSHLGGIQGFCMFFIVRLEVTKLIKSRWIP
jgi:CubicO group peptidase (beta-lactamase class C family)